MTNESTSKNTSAASRPVIAFCGKPNVGKSALINALAGSRLRVGNWQGVTVERYEAHTQWQWQGQTQDLHLMDLPGLRDTSCSTQDQCIASNFLFDESLAVCVNVVEASNLRENLSLTLRLRELFQGMDVPMIMALNFADELGKLGWTIDTQALEAELGCPVVMVSARLRTGVDKLKEKIQQLYSQVTAQSTKNQTGWRIMLKRDLLNQPNLAEVLQTAQRQDASPPPLTWHKIFAEFPQLLRLQNLQEILPESERPNLNRQLELLEATGDKPDPKQNYQYFEQRFLWFKERASEIAQKCLVRGQDKHRLSYSEKADHVLLHPVLGPFLGIFSMLIIFSITFSFADPFIGFVDQFFSGFLYDQVGKITGNAPFWLDSLIRDGILTGLGLILSFTPLMLVLYILIGIMEESGYMMRIAFMADRGMARMGVSGKSLIPLFMGFGCNVPSIYATRTLESEGEKRITGFLAGFMSCGARMPVLGLFTATFLGPWAGFAVVSLYLLGILVAVLVSLLLKRLHYFENDGKAFVIDLPPYRWPLLQSLGKTAGFRTWSYVKRASTRILALLIALWLFTFFPAHGDIEKSYAASFAKWVQPVFEPLGFGNRWQLIGAMPTSIIAKEGALAALGQFMGGSTAPEAGSDDAVTDFHVGLAEQGFLLWESIQEAFHFDIIGFISGSSESAIESDYGRGIIGAVRDLWQGDPLAPIRSLSFAIFILLVVPCIVVLGAMRQEFGAKFVTGVTFAYLLIPYVASLMFFQFSRLLFG